PAFRRDRRQVAIPARRGPGPARVTRRRLGPARVTRRGPGPARVARGGLGPARVARRRLAPARAAPPLGHGRICLLWSPPRAPHAPRSVRLALVTGGARAAGLASWRGWGRRGDWFERAE